MNRHTSIFICLLMICVNNIFVSTYLQANVIEQIMFRQITTSDGLTNNNINCLYRDSRGFLWIGTNSGLNRYDSYNFQQYYQDIDNLPDNRINNIFEDWNGNICKNPT